MDFEIFRRFCGAVLAKAAQETENLGQAQLSPCSEFFKHLLTFRGPLVERSECFWGFLVFWWHNRLHMMTAIKAYLTSFPLIYTVYLNDSLGLSARGVACPTSNVKAARSTTCVLSLLFWPFNLPYSRPCKGARKEPMHDDSSTVTVQQLVQSSDSNS